MATAGPTKVPHLDVPEHKLEAVLNTTAHAKTLNDLKSCPQLS